MTSSGHSSRSAAGLTPGFAPTSGSMLAKRDPRPRPRFSRAALRVLEEWLSSHRQSPYPTSSDLDQLTASIGLKRSQISNWFANVRKRRKVPLAELPLQTSEECMPQTIQISKVDENVPLFHRWLNSWTEQEASALPAILDAVSQLNGASSGDFLRGSTRFHRQFCPSESSLSSMEVRSYAANAKSVHSDEWKIAENKPTTLTQPRRRHRRLPVHVDSCSCSGRTDHQLVSKKYQCTFCPDRFRTKYDWQRHEKCIHLPLEKWTCSPHGSIDVDPVTNRITCTFCGILDPTPEHIGEHGYTICATRPVAERSFYRKDHLRQHLRLMHGSFPLLPSMESWKSVNIIRSRCGFCDITLHTWDDRVEHLADHFCDGLSVAEKWVGGWGFDDEVSSMLERASLPGESRSAKMGKRSPAPSVLTSMDHEMSFDIESSFFETESFADYTYDGFESFDPTFVWDDSMALYEDFVASDPPYSDDQPKSREVPAPSFISEPQSLFEDDFELVSN